MEKSDASVNSIKEQTQPQIPPIRTQIEETLGDQEELEDRISQLPDCLLLEILSRLPDTGYAIRTGILSKRWKSLWTSIPTLIFKHCSHRISYCEFEFVSLVNKTLGQCRHSRLNKFDIDMDFNSQLESQINRWIIDAIARDVKVLSVRFWHWDWTEPQFLLDESVFINSCFIDLSLGRCILEPNGAISWKMLRRLCVSEVCLDEDLIENILSGSPVLECLELDTCYGYNRLNVISKSVKKLGLFGYGDPNEDHLAAVIEINAPNILSLKIKNDLVLWKLLLLNVTSLVEVELDYSKFGYSEMTHRKANKEMLKGLIQSLRHVKQLKIGTSCSKPLVRLEAEGFPIPSNLKFPKVTYPLSSDSDSWEEEDLSDVDSLENEDPEVPLVDHGPDGH